MRPAWALQRGNGSWPWSAKLTDLLTVLADCPEARSVSIQDRCKPRMISRRIKSARRLAARIGFGANGEGEGRVCRECAVFRHRFGSDERHRPMAISSNPPRSTRKSARAALGSRRPQSLDYLGR